ncbi:MAG: hypothetical protein AABX10_00755 [Nanoarchaeota archaeon]
METETKLLELIAMDRIEIPISSMSGKLKRQKPKLAGEIDLQGKAKYQGERCYARIESEDLEVARGIREGVDEFAKRFPKYGTILNGLIEEKRTEKETHLYFGMKEDCRLSEGDYMGVMQSLGFTENAARSLYPELMSVSRNLSRKRDEERRILIG